MTLEFQVRNSRSENPDPRVALHERVQKMSRNKVSQLRYWPDQWFGRRERSLPSHQKSVALAAMVSDLTMPLQPSQENRRKPRRDHPLAMCREHGTLFAPNELKRTRAPWVSSVISQPLPLRPISNLDLYCQLPGRMSKYRSHRRLFPVSLR